MRLGAARYVTLRTLNADERNGFHARRSDGTRIWSIDRPIDRLGTAESGDGERKWCIDRGEMRARHRGISFAYKRETHVRKRRVSPLVHSRGSTLLVVVDCESAL